MFGSPRRVRAVVLASTASALVLAACGEERPASRSGPTSTRAFTVPAPLNPVPCNITVDGVGEVDIEDDYLPHVITCENGGANLEALKAQAIAARSVAYYAIETTGSICDSQGCQVYGCGATPSATAYEAVAATAGQYLSFNQTLTYGFYVAGDNQTSPPSCVGTATTGTETWVTYNEGKTGTQVEQTALGFIHDPADPGYGQNRGCMSQWGARCLENSLGYDVLGILRFYYGADIELIKATGACLPDDPGTTTSATTDASSGGTFEDGSSGEEEAGGDTDASGTADGGSAGTSTDAGADSQGSDSATSGAGEAGSVGSDAESEASEVGSGGADDVGSDASGDQGCACDLDRRGDRGSPGLLLFVAWLGLSTSRWRRRAPLA